MVGAFNPFTFKVITDKYDPIAIYFIVWGLNLYTVFVFPVLFGVTLDYLVRTENVEEAVSERKTKEVTFNRRAVSYIAEGGGWIVAIFAFIVTTLITNQMTFQWLYFVYALPVVLIVKLVFNSIWFNPRHNYLIVSALLWSILATIHITFLYYKINVSLIYLLGVAGQIVIVLASYINKPKTK